jgi:hypothetical protein
MDSARPIVAGHDPRLRARAPIELALIFGRLLRTRVIVACVQAAPPVLPISALGALYAVGLTDEDLVADCAAPLAEVQSDLGVAGTPVECRTHEGPSAARALQDEVEPSRRSYWSSARVRGKSPSGWRSARRRSGSCRARPARWRSSLRQAEAPSSNRVASVTASKSWRTSSA